MTTLTIALLAAAGVAAIVGLVVAVLVIEARAIERAGDALGDDFDETDTWDWADDPRNPSNDNHPEH